MVNIVFLLHLSGCYRLRLITIPAHFNNYLRLPLKLVASYNSFTVAVKISWVILVHINWIRARCIYTYYWSYGEMHLLRNKTTLWGGSRANAMTISVSNAARPRWLRIRFFTYPKTSSHGLNSGEYVGRNTWCGLWCDKWEYGVTRGRTYHLHSMHVQKGDDCVDD